MCVDAIAIVTSCWIVITCLCTKAVTEDETTVYKMVIDTIMVDKMIVDEMIGNEMIGKWNDW